MGDEVHIKLKENRKPFCGRPYPNFLKQVKLMKEKVYHKCGIVAMQELSQREAESYQWAFYSFKITGKNDKIYLVVDI